MKNKVRERLEAAIQMIDEQRSHLPELYKKYYTHYDAIFNADSVRMSVSRWADRTAQLLSQHIGDQESENFRRVLLNPFPRGNWEFKEHLQMLDTFLDELAKDIEHHPDQYASVESAKATEKVPGAQWDVFLSYSNLDRDEARQLAAGLESAGRRCFMAEEKVAPGDDFSDKIRQALKTSNEIWILLSPNSLKSLWVHREVSAAWALEKPIVPILFRCSDTDMPDFIKHIQAVDYHRAVARKGKSG